MDLEGQLKMYENSVGDMNKKDGYDCPICKNKGFTFFIRGDEIVRDKCYIQAFLREEGGLRSKTEGECVTNSIITHSPSVSKADSSLPEGAK